MITAKVRLFDKTIQLGSYGSLHEALKSCLPGFKPHLSSFQTTSSKAFATIIGRDDQSSMMRQFERTIAELEADSGKGDSDSFKPHQIELLAVKFVYQKLGGNVNPTLLTAWSQALIEGIQPHEMELSFEGSFGKEEIEKNLAQSSYSA